MIGCGKNPRDRLGAYRRNGGLLLMVALPLGLLILFNYVPMVGVVIAFKDFILTKGILASPWVGWENFARLFESDDFPRALRNTLVISLLRLAFGFFAPIALALMLNELRVSVLKRGVQTLTYLPYFFSWVILGGIFLMILSGNGPLNSVLKACGVSKGVPFLSNWYWFLAVLVATGIWQSAGYGSVIYLAALAGIDPTLYEAAAVDGASRWRQTRHITLPCLVPTMIVLFILSLGGVLSAGFDQVYNMKNDGVMATADIIDTYVFRRMMDMDYALAGAAGVFKSVVSLVLIVGANWTARRLSRGQQGIW